ncbi:VanW family protein [Cellulomonas taurus]|uniref:VanW family protein n=1 Tax=Cellulomonas taurus TaxID=2729175 RepID=UPI00145F30EB|nr:VanW family protein [Cellulomonas taurus]
MGQGTSEGTVPEDNTPDTGRDEADDARTAGPDAPTPVEADTATRQTPVVPEGDDGAVSDEGDDRAGLAEDDDAAASTEGDDGATEAVDGDRAAAENGPVGDDVTGSDGGPATDDAPATDSGPATDDSSGTDGGPATDDSTGTDGGPSADDTPAADGPAPDRATVTDDAPAGDDAPDGHSRPSRDSGPADQVPSDDPAPVIARSDADVAEPDTPSPSAATAQPTKSGADAAPASAESAAAAPGVSATTTPTDGVPRTRASAVDPANDPRARAVATLTAAAAAAAAAEDARMAAASERAATAQGAAPVVDDATAGTQPPTDTDGPSAERIPVAERTPLAAAAPSPADVTAPTQRIASTDPAAQDSGAQPVAGQSDATTVLPAVPGSTPTAAGTPGDGTPAAAVAGHPEEGSPLDVFESEPDRKRRWWRPVLIVAGVVVVLAGAYVGGAYALAERVPRGTTVAGIEVGGMSADDARAALTEGLAERSSQPITVTAREVSGTVDPAAAGLTFDVDATVDSLTGIDLSPQRMWRHLTGGTEETPVTEVDDTKLTAAVEDLSGALTLAPVDGSVVFVDGKPQGVAAVDGWSLDTEGARDTLADGWLTEALPIELPSDTVAPTITQDEVDRVVRDVASAVVSGPVTVTVADQSAELPVDVLTGAASFVPQGAELVLTMDGAALVDQVVDRTSNLLTTAADATFEFADGAPTIVPGTPGTTLDPAALATAVATAAASTSDRTAPVELVESDPSQSTEALQALGVTTAVSEFSTPLTSEPKRTQNITAGAAAINGTLIRPGETFSLTEALGPIDSAHGFVQAGAIVNGEHSDAWGGGLSQLSTTTFNAAFEAGMEDVEHQPHSEWFTRYPAGREATLYTGSIDMKWKNTTPYGVLVQAYVADGKTWVRLWSTPYYEVAITSGAKTNVVSPTTVYNTSPTCSASSAGNPGFSITVTRTVSLNGQVQDTDNLSWRYKPQNKVVCGPDPATAAPPAG